MTKTSNIIIVDLYTLWNQKLINDQIASLIIKNCVIFFKFRPISKSRASVTLKPGITGPLLQNRAFIAHIMAKAVSLPLNNSTAEDAIEWLKIASFS